MLSFRLNIAKRCPYIIKITHFDTPPLSFYHGKYGNRRGWVTEFFFWGGGSRYAAALNVTEAGAAAPGPPGTEGVWSESR